VRALLPSVGDVVPRRLVYGCAVPAASTASTDAAGRLQHTLHPTACVREATWLGGSWCGLLERPCLSFSVGAGAYLEGHCSERALGH